MAVMDKVKPLKQGLQVCIGGRRGYRWAVLDRDQVENWLGSHIDNPCVLGDYLGWSAGKSDIPGWAPKRMPLGPSRRVVFVGLNVRSYRKKLLVIQAWDRND